MNKMCNSIICKITKKKKVTLEDFAESLALYTVLCVLVTFLLSFVGDVINAAILKLTGISLLPVDTVPMSFLSFGLIGFLEYASLGLMFAVVCNAILTPISKKWEELSNTVIAECPLNNEK